MAEKNLRCPDISRGIRRLLTDDSGLKIRSLDTVKFVWTYLVLSPAVKRIKIGQAEDVSKRLSSLQIGSGDELQLVAAICGPSNLESRLHTYFDFCRAHGEWFDICPDLWEFVEACVSGIVEDRLEFLAGHVTECDTTYLVTGLGEVNEAATKRRANHVAQLKQDFIEAHENYKPHRRAKCAMDLLNAARKYGPKVFEV